MKNGPAGPFFNSNARYVGRASAVELLQLAFLRVAARLGAGAASVSVAAPALSPAFGAFGALGALTSNSKPTLPSLPRTRKAENLRRVRADTKPLSSSVLPSVSSLAICSRSIGCCRMILPERKSQLLPGPTDFSHTLAMACSNALLAHFGQAATGC